MISRAFKKMTNSGLKRETLVLLLSDSSGVGKPTIRFILNAMGRLETEYLEKEK